PPLRAGARGCRQRVRGRLRAPEAGPLLRDDAPSRLGGGCAERGRRRGLADTRASPGDAQLWPRPGDRRRPRDACSELKRQALAELWLGFGERFFTALLPSCFEKNSSAVRVFVCCAVPRSIPREARKTRVAAATSNASEGSHFVESSRIREPSG